jgi:hypothetical protein
MSAFNTAESEHASREAQLLESYQPSAGVFDELSDGHGGKMGGDTWTLLAHGGGAF